MKKIEEYLIHKDKTVVNYVFQLRIPIKTIINQPFRASDGWLREPILFTK